METKPALTWLQHARPHLRRTTIFGVIAIVAAVAGSRGSVESEDAVRVVLALAGAALVLVAGALAVRAAGRAARTLTAERAGDARGATLGLVVTIVGYLVVLITALVVLDVDVSGLLLGGAITGVVLGIAGQQVLANFFAGVVLLAVRPLSVGDHLVMRSGPLGGEYEGTVTDMSLFYVDLLTPRGPVKLPNSGVLASAIGPGARAPADAESDDETSDADPAEGGQAPKSPP